MADSPGSALTAKVTSGPPVLADGPVADGVGDRRGPARGQAELHAGGGVDGGRAGEADGEGLAHPEVGRGQGGAGQLGEQAVAEEGEGDLQGEVALVEGEGEVGEGPPAVGAPQEEGRALGPDEDVGASGAVELLGLGDADLGQVEAGQEGVVGCGRG